MGLSPSIGEPFTTYNLYLIDRCVYYLAGKIEINSSCALRCVFDSEKIISLFVVVAVVETMKLIAGQLISDRALTPPTNI